MWCHQRTLCKLTHTLCGGAGVHVVCPLTCRLPLRCIFFYLAQAPVSPFVLRAAASSYGPGLSHESLTTLQTYRCKPAPHQDAQETRLPLPIASPCLQLMPNFAETLDVLSRTGVPVGLWRLVWPVFWFECRHNVCAGSCGLAPWCLSSRIVRVQFSVGPPSPLVASTLCHLMHGLTPSQVMGCVCVNC